MILKRFGILISLFIAACQPSTRTATPPSPRATSTPEDVPTIAPTLTKLSPTVPVPTVPASNVELEGAEVPPGFSLIKFANLYRPTAFAFDSQANMYVTSQDGNVYLLQDDDLDGRADSQVTFSSGYYFPLGVTVHDSTGDVYVSHQGKITVLTDTDDDGKADVQKGLVDDLPFDIHMNNNLKFGPDGWLYIGIGSACKACYDTDPRSATIMRFNIETAEGEIYAKGLRNPFDIAFHTETGDLFATDNGRDDLGMEIPFEELNHIIKNGDYGYPDCWNEQNIPGCEDTIPAVAFFEAHSSADGLDFYDGETFPAEYHGNAFVSIFGSWLKPNVQTGIQRVVLRPSGETYIGESSWFIRFPAGVMPLPLLFGSDDALYLGDYVNDAIYRISYGLP
ncbi:MAG TPA: PQQ-dependent sugar dehydrogenase [Anaerolineales bacterium]|nr:PQQ-dependent sugar dehydrogenase [Anaerolineales bacterium]